VRLQQLFVRWFAAGLTNLGHDAVDRHLPLRAAQAALIWVSTEVDQRPVYTLTELHIDVQRMAAVLQSPGVEQGRADGIDLPAPIPPAAGWGCRRW